MQFLSVNIHLFIYLSIIFASCAVAKSIPSNFPPPSVDPFYAPPSGYKHALPGQILKSRELPRESLSIYGTSQNISNVYQILYRTTDSGGKPTATVTTVIIPYNADKSKLVSYQVMQNSIFQDCTISYAIHTPNTFNLLTSQLEMLALDPLLRRGWCVAIPDHWGPSNLVGLAAMGGHATLDGIRAVLSSSNFTDIQPQANVQMWGYSSGALATCSAVELQPTYAPELQNNIIASSLGGIPVNINATFAQSSNTFFSELSIVGMNSFMLVDKKFAAHIDSALRPEMKDQFYKVRNLCFAELAYEYAFRDLGSFFTQPDYANHHVVEKMLKANVLGQADTPTIPLFIYHATDDDVTPLSDVEQLYSKWCSNGANIEMVQDDTFRHMGFYLAGMGDLLQNLERQFKYPHSFSGCSIRRTTTAILDHGAFSTFVKALIDAFYGIFGFPLGPKTTVPAK